MPGLNTKKRFGFQRMMKDAKQGKFKILMIKSISRFGRNMTDTSGALDILLNLGIRVIFVEDRIDSANAGDIEKFGLFAWLAEIESRKISERIKITFDKMKNDGYYFGSKPPYGYYKKKGKLYINKEESQVVKMIYDLYLYGYGATNIVNKLTEMNISPPLAKTWNEVHIKRILTNPVYTGDTYTNQSSTIDIKTRKRIVNNFNEWNYFPNTHEAIISKEEFEKVQLEMERRRNMFYKNNRPSTTHLFSNLIKCGRCGYSYVLKKRYDYKTPKHWWSCWNYEKHGTKGCTSVRIEDNKFRGHLLNIFQLLKDHKNILLKMVEVEKDIISYGDINLKNTLDDLLKHKEKLNKKLQKLLELYSEDFITKLEYIEQSKPIHNEIAGISAKIDDIQKKLAMNDDVDKRLKEFLEKIDILCDPDKWTNQLLKEHVYAIIIYEKDLIEVVLQIQKNSFEFTNKNNSTYLDTSTVVGVWKGIHQRKTLDFQCLSCQNILMSTNTLELKINDYPIKIYNDEDDNEVRLSIFIDKKNIDESKLNKQGVMKKCCCAKCSEYIGTQNNDENVPFNSI